MTQWQRTTLGEALPIRYGKARSDKAGTVREDSPVYGSSGVIGKFNRALTSGPALIIGRKGTVGATHYSAEPSWPIDTVYFTEGSEGKDLRFFKYLLDHLQLGRMDRSTAVPGLSRDDYNAKEVAIPGYDEQQRIVAEIEKQFTRLDAGVASLKRVQTALKRYRASVLKAACEGRLVPTEAELARKENRSYETGEQLLRCILEERREKWHGKGKYKEPPIACLSDLETLPDGWTWASIEQLSSLVTDGDHNPPKRQQTGLPHLTAKNIRNWRLDTTNCTFISAFDAKRVLKRYEPLAGDLIITCVGTVGRTAIVPADFKFSPDRNLAAIRLVDGDTSARYLNLVLSSPAYQKLIKSASGSTAQPHLYLGDLRALVVPLPPVAEQRRIIAEAERRLSVIEQLEATASTELQRAAHLRQSILLQAFSSAMDLI